jgi:choice-of-anchor C domain-containing protein
MSATALLLLIGFLIGASSPHAPRTAAAAAISPAPGRNVLANGNFADGPPIPSKGWRVLYAGSTAISGWRVSRGNIDYVGGYWAAPGGRSIDLDGAPGAGGIEQTFATVRGHTYVVSFDLAGNPDGPPRFKRLAVAVAGHVQSFTFDVRGHTKSAMGYTRESLSFVATATSTTVEFFSRDPDDNDWGPVLANVSVTESGAPNEASQTAVPATAVPATAAPSVRLSSPAPQARTGIGTDHAQPNLTGLWAGTYGNASLQVQIEQTGSHVVARVIQQNGAPPATRISWDGNIIGRHFVVFEICRGAEDSRPLVYGATMTLNGPDAFDLSKTACIDDTVRFNRVK